ncbi:MULTISPECIES: pirin family protein [unclassified Polaromonas]|uniref:pirin family protein n=1 Tax=unclassified Polaromonas TaxID=2638319 RepID=UPI0018CA1202|nr:MULTISPECIES: pirin family protein [unclassified Polaromonas]MBG6071323.1 redox-sensitive bicupin YhaK (pirin superfamily) [Polaromonas sp. CG_9.7]MBG6113324.1 redox-sensitive bicupin YhaK (pirin superfamily) [Polaromonas sp. CG_9.2]MDH6183222.1 redox-sensitive bicupin YhaK (pirin superfamily) [Polaromonas sp. CG_23.6]
MSSLPVDAPTPSGSPVLRVEPLGFPWPTVDPFLFCVYHDDAYPAANARNGPAAPLDGRDIGQDFSRKDGWSMYHGSTVPGFPAHPHRGFETVTIVRKGLIDHADSLGATARFGRGDVQWLTAGQGVVHSEMFPLLDQGGPNPLELFQIWLNLPAARKMAAPHFTMFWAQDIPKFTATDREGRTTDVAVITGRLNDPNADVAAPLPPPPDSWAAQPDADVAIWTLRMAPGARWTLPAAVGKTTRRQLYFFKGESVSVAGQPVRQSSAIGLRADAPVELVNGPQASEFLLLQGRPIGEPVAQQGPFVMNTETEIRQAFADYQRTRFGGWPWPDAAPVHGRESSRFALHPDGAEERPEPGATALEPARSLPG